MALTLIVPPALEPLEVAEAKLYARVTHTDEDELFQALIQTARELVEGRGIAIHTQTWELSLDRFPVCIRVPIAPLQSVTSITYTDADGASQVLASSGYTVDTRSRPARILPAYGTSWPATRAVPNAVIVKFVAGLDPSQPTLIRSYERVRQFLKEAVRAMYERDPVPDHVNHLLDDLAVYA